MESHGWCDGCHVYALLHKGRLKGEQFCLACHPRRKAEFEEKRKADGLDGLKKSLLFDKTQPPKRGGGT